MEPSKFCRKFRFTKKNIIANTQIYGTCTANFRIISLIVTQKIDNIASSKIPKFIMQKPLFKLENLQFSRYIVLGSLGSVEFSLEIVHCWKICYIYMMYDLFCIVLAYAYALKPHKSVNCKQKPHELVLGELINVQGICKSSTCSRSDNLAGFSRLSLLQPL